MGAMPPALPRMNDPVQTPELFPSDAELAADLGLPITTLKALRTPETEGSHWIRKKGGAWTAAGVEAIRAQYVPGLAGAPAPVPETPAPPASLEVATRPVPNRHLLPCVRPGVDRNDRTQWILVRVRDNALFMPGMLIRAERVVGGAEWRYLGRAEAPEGQIRYPRGRGVW